MCMTLNEKVWSLSNDPSIQCIHRICNIVYPCQGQQSTPPKKEKNLNHCLHVAYILWNGSCSLEALGIGTKHNPQQCTAKMFY